MALFDNSNTNAYNSGANQFSGSQIGGGYVSNTQENNFNASNISTKPQQQRIPYDQRKLSQVTIKQIITTAPPQPDEHLIIDNVEISQLQMIAQIMSIQLQSTHTTLKVNDYTGILEVKQWHGDEQQPQSSNLHEGTWVRIVGRINHFQGRCSVNAFQIIPITNYDQITHHFLECIYSHLLNTMPKPKMNNNNNNNNNNGNNNQWNNNNNNNNRNNNNNNRYNNNNNNMNNNNNNMNNNNNNNFRNSLPAIQSQILNVINKPEYANNNAQGCNVEIIFKQLSNENIDEIRTAIDELANAGYIYSTIDDDHYKYSGDPQ